MKLGFYKYALLSASLILLSVTGLKAQTVTFTPTNVTCFGAADAKMKIDVVGGTSNYRYICLNLEDLAKSDSFGPTTQLSYTFLNRKPGPGQGYLFMVRDLSTGLTIGAQLYEFSQPAVLNASYTSTNVACFGSSTGTITISGATGGSGVYDYTINGGTSWQNTGAYSALPAGSYNVQVRDRNNPGCFKILNAALLITQNAQLNATLTSTNPTCFGVNNGTITISAPSGGSGSGYQYTINGGITWSSALSYTALAPATYNVMMRDASVPSCTRTLNSSLVLTQPAQLATFVSIKKGLTCYESTDAQLQANVTGGTGPYVYDWYVYSGSWVSIGQTGPVAMNLGRGRYQVRVNDINGCGPVTAGIFFLEGPAPGFAGDSIPPQFYFDSASVVNTCAGQSNGTITIYAHGGVSPLRYSITAGGASGYQAGNLFSSLGPGNYQTWAIDKRGCKKNGAGVTVGTTPNSPVNVTIAANPTGSICPATSVTFTATPANGGTAPTYQWKLNGANAGLNQPTYTNAALANGDQVNVILTSNLRCTVGNPATSNTITIALKTVTSITTQPQPVTQCAGTNASFSVVAAGTNLSYQWRKDGATIAGATNSTYTINNIAAVHAGNYSVVVTGDCGIVTSANALLTINPVTAITAQPLPLTQCAGTNATFTVTAAGTALTYQWRKNGSNIAGATAASYTINNIASGDAGNYSVVVSGSCGPNVTSNNAALVVNPITVITAQPLPVTQCAGTNATFSVTATGTSLTYQWRKNGTNITGATASTYTINNIAAADAASYSVVVSGSCGANITSNAVALTVNPATAITTQPQALTRCVGTSATFTVAAVGTNLTYQWRKNGANIAGATGVSYTIAAVVAGDAGNYSVVVTGVCGGSVTSNAVALIVNPATAINAQPLPLTQCAGTNATFTVVAVGTNLTYQWRKNGTNITGATASTYTINNITAADAASYSVVVSGDCGGSVTSNAVALVVNPITAITVQPLPLSQCVGTNATFTVTAVGVNLTYQWRKNGANIIGANAATYTINNISASDAASYTVVVSGDCGAAVTSNAATLVVNPATAITTQPLPVTQCAGTTATFTVVATGTTLTYQWRKDGVNIPGATNNTYSIANIAAANAGSYSVVVSGSCGANVTSNSVTLTVNPATAITVQPAPVTVCVGAPALFSVTAVGTNLGYQWRKNGSNIPGATGSSYSIAAVALTDAGNYSVVVSGDCGASVTSGSAALTVNPATSITTQPQPLTRCAGTSATFTVVAGGTSLTYQWRKDGVNITGATGSTYTIASVAAGDAGNYSVVVSGSCGPNITSGNAALVVNPATSITTQPTPLTQCAGTSATFTVTAIGTNLTYQWRKNGTNIPGATAAAYNIPAIVASDAGNYSVVVSGDCGASVTSTSVALVVNPLTAITAQPQPVTVCVGSAASFNVTAVGTSLTYQWMKNGTDIPSATTSTYSIAATLLTDAGNYSVRVTGTCGGTVISANAALVVNPATAINTQPANVTECVGNSATFSVTAVGTNLTYQWKKNGSNIAGATGSFYTIAAIVAGDAGNYTVAVNGTCGNVVSNIATLTVNTPPSITTHPQGLTECPGSNVIFSVTASGANLTYVWRKNGTPLVPAQTNSTLTINNINAGNAGNYDVIVSNSCGDATSNTATLTVAENPLITLQPADRDLCEGGDVSFSVNATGTGITYQWRRNGTNLAGQTSSILNLTSVTLANGGSYDVLVYGLCDTITSNTATLLVYPATVVDIEENDTLVCAESTVEFHANASGYGALTYQWQLFYFGAWIDISDNSHITGTNTPLLTINNANAADTGNYRCQVFAGCGTVNSNPVRLDVNVIIATIGTPAPFMINSGTTSIEVGIKVTNHFLLFDLGFALVAPDGTEVMLKSPIPDPCVYSSPVNIDARFSNKLPASDSMNYCLASTNITGTFGAAGDWSVLNGMDPSNGAWQVRVYDQDKAVLDPDGFLTSATLRFTDLNNEGDTAIVTYNSGVISEGILNPLASELRPTSYIVPIRLSTSCFNTEDAKAVVTVDGGIPPYTYSWTGPTVENGSATVDLGPGIYTVTVTDALGCTAEASVEVSAPAPIIYNDVQFTDTIVCYGSADGMIRAKASGGSGGITYTLLPGNIASSVADSGVFTNLAAGAYSIRATDINGCSFDTVVHIYQHTELIVDIATVPVIGSNPGSIVLLATGGVPPYMYSIDNGTTMQDSGKFNNLPAGIYQIYVEDALGCTFTDEVNLNAQLLNVAVTKHDVSCNGLADGSFYMALIDGTGPYTLTGSFTDTLVINSGAFSFTGQTAGLYDVKIEDSEGRIFMDTIEILEPVAILATANITEATCSQGTNDGAIDVTITGGSGEFTYTWSNGATTEDLVDIPAGIYEIEIADTNGCSSNKFPFFVDSKVDVYVWAGDNQVVCPGEPFTMIGSAADSSYWTPSEYVSPQFNDTTTAVLKFDQLFYYTVIDKVSGCGASDTVRIFVPYVPEMVISSYPEGEPLDSVIYVGLNEGIMMQASNGFDYFEWLPDQDISDNSQSVVTSYPQTDITYIAIGTTSIGCKSRDTIKIILRRPIKIYSGFSPNGDQYNETWVIENAEQWGDKIHVRVFNRWGEPVFESKGYGGSQEWDGTRNGRLMPVGSYYYIVDIKDGMSLPYTGTVTILR
jgi:gliding motility-associated-like protein